MVFFLSLPAEVVTAANPLLSSPFCLKQKAIFQFYQVIVGRFLFLLFHVMSEAVEDLLIK